MLSEAWAARATRHLYRFAVAILLGTMATQGADAQAVPIVLGGAVGHFETHFDPKTRIAGFTLAQHYHGGGDAFSRQRPHALNGRWHK